MTKHLDYALDAVALPDYGVMYPRLIIALFKVAQSYDYVSRYLRGR